MLTQLSPPAAEPLTLAEAKLHLRVDADITEDDGLIAALIVTARQQAEHRTGRALISQQWRLGPDLVLGQRSRPGAAKNKQKPKSKDNQT